MHKIAQPIHHSQVQVAQASACVFLSALYRINPRRLKPAPLSAQGKKSLRDFAQRFGLATAMTVSLVALPLAAQQTTHKGAAAPAPKRDLSGLWHYEGTGGSEPIAPDKLIPQ